MKGYQNLKWNRQRDLVHYNYIEILAKTIPIIIPSRQHQLIQFNYVLSFQFKLFKISQELFKFLKDSLPR